MVSAIVVCCVVVVVLLATTVSVHECVRIEQLKELHKDATSISLEWRVSPSDSGGGGDASSAEIGAQQQQEKYWIGFKIKYFTDKLQYTPVLLKNVNLRKFRLDNLKSNTEYRIQVSAFSALETEGPASNLLTVRTAEAGRSNNNNNKP
jgi:hypothetical protein